MALVGDTTLSVAFSNGKTTVTMTTLAHVITACLVVLIYDRTRVNRLAPNPTSVESRFGDSSDIRSSADVRHQKGVLTKGLTTIDTQLFLGGARRGPFPIGIRVFVPIIT